MRNALLGNVRGGEGRRLGDSAVEYSGVASFLLRVGRPARSKLKAPPVRVAKWSICAVQKGSGAAKYQEGIALVIWGASPMAHSRLAECLGMALRDIREGNMQFGGVLVVFGGDFRHPPPIVLHGIRANVVASSLKRSPMRRTMRNRVLTRNLGMLIVGGKYADYLIKIGDGPGGILGGDDAIDPPPLPQSARMRRCSMTPSAQSAARCSPI